ncbi:urease accessory protein UreD [Bizionia argentinensis JUB59]|uniref:Urease accessory protein UreD n=1 Tax=Bizionia argentinensis JUB59 TaxID=1046627 RepID=G2EGE9_9FLAO|nr:urease accessory protein UreD [Bizionia argentinensis]EGV42516.1 urease accessory protein UreD [Bizionia argentinensis JUB59]
MERYSLKTGLREQTILKDVYFTSPFNLVEVRENKKNQLLEMMLMSSSPGLLNNDFYDITIEVIDGSALNLQTQSYQRIFVSEKGTQQNMAISVGDDAYFSHVPHPTVPHKGAKYKAKNAIHIKGSSTLLWGEILTCGRKYMAEGEEFQFKKHHTVTEIYQDDVMIFKDNLYIVPEEINLKQFGLYEEYTHQGSLFFIAPETDITERMERISEVFSKEKGISFGISKMMENAYSIRVLGNEAQQLYKLFTQIRKDEDLLINLQGRKN